MEIDKVADVEKASVEDSEDISPVIIMGKAKSVQLINGETKIVCVAGTEECCRVYPTRTIYAETTPVIVVDEDGNILFEGQVESYEIITD